MSSHYCYTSVMPEELKKFFEITKNKPAHERTVEAIEILARDRSLDGLEALDFGCGSGRDSQYMASLGMKVTAVDANTSGIKDSLGHSQNIEVIESRFDEFEFKKYDFISSQFALSFNSPETFTHMFSKLLASLNSNGLLACNIFGPKDEWANDKAKTFLSKEQISKLIDESLEVLEIEEVDEDSFIANGTPKHWNYFNLLVRKK